MPMGIRAARDDDDSQLRIRQRSVGGKQTYPASLASVTSTSLSSDSLRWIISTTSGAVINGAYHSRDHALENGAVNVQFAPDFSFEARRFLCIARNLRLVEFASICHSRNQTAELQWRNFKSIRI